MKFKGKFKYGFPSFIKKKPVFFDFMQKRP